MAPAPPPAPHDAIRVETEIGGLRSSYYSRFEHDQLIGITEKRVVANGMGAEAQYEFQGARLLRYEGEAFGDREPLVVEFNLQSTVISARKASGPAPESEIAHVRNRAQLLRSHALAQHASRAHSAAVRTQSH